MKKVYIFFANGFEEVEAITVVDVLRRAGADVKLVSINWDNNVEGAHGLKIVCDCIFDRCNFDDADLLVLPGGMPGTDNLRNHLGLIELVKEANKKGTNISAICAAPIILGKNNLLVGKKATCYPGCEGLLNGATVLKEKVVEDGNIITSNGPASALDFSLSLAKRLFGEEVANSVAKAMLAL